MKTLTINSVQYQLVLQSYKEWLETLNYSKSVVKNYPNYIQELLHYVETKNTHQLSELTATMVEGFIEHVKLRKMLPVEVDYQLTISTVSSMASTSFWNT